MAYRRRPAATATSSSSPEPSTSTLIEAATSSTSTSFTPQHSLYSTATLAVSVSADNTAPTVAPNADSTSCRIDGITSSGIRAKRTRATASEDIDLSLCESAPVVSRVHLQPPSQLGAKRPRHGAAMHALPMSSSTAAAPLDSTTEWDYHDDPCRGSISDTHIEGSNLVSPSRAQRRSVHTPPKSTSTTTAFERPVTPCLPSTPTPTSVSLSATYPPTQHTVSIEHANTLSFTSSAIAAINADEEFARQLQEQEYSAIQPPTMHSIYNRVHDLTAALSSLREEFDDPTIDHEDPPEASDIDNCMSNTSDADSDDLSSVHDVDSSAFDLDHTDELDDESGADEEYQGGWQYLSDTLNSERIQPISSYYGMASDALNSRSSRSARLRRGYSRQMADLGSWMASSPRNYLRDDELDSTYEGLLALSEQIGSVVSKGTPAEVIVAIPTRTYSSGSPTHRNDIPRCAICLEDYCDEDVIKTLPGCGHEMHGSCVSNWLLNSKLCPICRSDITTAL
ncbi:hypothetical protein BASA50_009369 [Batrachochytrium salamandrivorans]|uniref:RING-type E3 ubiquitin transferase n=1 Tax=Batrachochytrium salamandrivorans TaxID=1357716 RepID=A0ABQ8F1H0_9FUNG|nr:hypothetical protein BASA61_007372 [Batrachochytrium salamandrivorans]KAH6590394.1 hypothetical protein BASA50_009369 [Batrachochytrium salamandrivorans]KAH9273183.1 hypothetical protein BASA83_004472 [Batrachochytrium salamandrivorans]